MKKSKYLPGIIIEGSDQTGKSTIVKKLSEKLGLPIIHHKRSTDEANFDYFNGYFQEIDSGKYKTGLIFDRSYLSEVVYGTVKRGGSHIDYVLQTRIEEKFSDLGYFLVILLRDEERWEDRPEYVTKEENQEIEKFYIDEAMSGFRLPSLVIHPHTDIKKIIDGVITLYRVQQKRINLTCNDLKFLDLGICCKTCHSEHTWTHNIGINSWMPSQAYFQVCCHTQENLSDYIIENGWKNTLRKIKQHVNAKKN